MDIDSNSLQNTAADLQDLAVHYWTIHPSRLPIESWSILWMPIVRKLADRFGITTDEQGNVNQNSPWFAIVQFTADSDKEWYGWGNTFHVIAWQIRGNTYHVIAWQIVQTPGSFLSPSTDHLVSNRWRQPSVGHQGPSLALHSPKFCCNPLDQSKGVHSHLLLGWQHPRQHSIPVKAMSRGPEF